MRKITGEWLIVHAFTKLNAATIPAQTPISRNDVIIDGMSKTTILAIMDLMTNFDLRLMWEEWDILYTAVSICSNMFWSGW